MDRGVRGARAGAAIGFILGSLTAMLFSLWIRDGFFWPIVLISAAIFALVFGLFFPLELSYRELDDDPDSITPTDRVSRLHADKESRNQAES
jgi:Na+/proline symporter